MKTARALSFSLALVLGLAAPLGAEQIQGFVEEIDPPNRTIRVKDPVSGAQKNVRVHPKALTDVKKGSVVKAVLKDGSDQADTLDVLIAR